MIVPKNTLLTNAKWSDITDSVLHYIHPKIHKESLISTNSYIDYDDAVNDGRLKAITVIEGVRHKWNIKGKKVSDLVNFVLRCVANYYSTARQKGALSIDTSVVSSDISFSSAFLDSISPAINTAFGFCLATREISLELFSPNCLQCKSEISTTRHSELTSLIVSL